MFTDMVSMFMKDLNPPPDPDYVQYGFRECVYENKGDERDGNKG